MEEAKKILDKHIQNFYKKNPMARFDDIFWIQVQAFLYVLFVFLACLLWLVFLWLFLNHLL